MHKRKKRDGVLNLYFMEVVMATLDPNEDERHRLIDNIRKLNYLLLKKHSGNSGDIFRMALIAINLAEGNNREAIDSVNEMIEEFGGESTKKE